MDTQTKTDGDLNRDPITGAPGSHPVGTGVGAAGGAATGAAIGAVGGPVGMAVGGVIGAIAGGLAGKAVAEEIDPTAENAHWEKNYSSEPYYKSDYNYGDYEPAYRMGYQRYSKNDGRSFDESERELSSDWDKTRGESRLAWEDAKGAVKAGWHRVERALPGDADGDGR